MRWLPFSFSSPQARADKLIRRGLSFVEEGKTAKALAVAKQLHSIRYSGAFEVEAQALDGEGLKDEAIVVLRKGLEAAPNAWLNGNLLGNYLSDQGRYDEAFAAYEAAMRAPTADRILIEANYVLALQRSGRDDEARAKIAEVLKQPISSEEPDLQTFVASVEKGLKPERPNVRHRGTSRRPPFVTPDLIRRSRLWSRARPDEE